MALNVRNGIKVVDGKAYIHPLTLIEIESLIAFLSNINVSGTDAEILVNLKNKLKQEHSLLKKHLNE